MERRPIGVEDILGRPEILLVIAGILTLIGGVGFAGIGLIVVIILGLAMIYSAVVSLGYIVILKDAVPVLSVSAISGGILFIFSIEWLARFRISHWSVILTFIASLIALFAAYVAYAKPSFARGGL